AACQTAPSPHTSPVGATQTGFSLIALRYRVALCHPHCRLHLWRRPKPPRRTGMRISERTQCREWTPRRVSSSRECQDAPSDTCTCCRRSSSCIGSECQDLSLSRAPYRSDEWWQRRRLSLGLQTTLAFLQ